MRLPLLTTSSPGSAVPSQAGLGLDTGPRSIQAVKVLRVSVTERCNFRCVYCMPAEGIKLAPKSELLTFEEIARVVRVGAELGLSKVRLTGGEPTVRHELPALVRMLADTPGVRELSMTT